MRRTQHLQKNRFGVYCFRYTFPKAFIEKYPRQPKTIHLSLKTRNKAIAIKRVQMLWLEVHRLMEQNWSDDRSDEQKIGEMLKYYRSCMATEEPWDRPHTEFDGRRYSTEDEFVEEQLWAIQRAGLLPELIYGDEFDQRDFENKEYLYAKALRKFALEKDARIEAIVEGGAPRAVPLTEQSSIAIGQLVEPSQDLISMSELVEQYQAYTDTGSDLAFKTRGKIKSHMEFLIGIIGDKPINKISKTDTAAFREALASKKTRFHGEYKSLSATTKNDYISTCRRVLDYAVDYIDGFEKNPLDTRSLLFKEGKDEKRIRLPFTSEELSKLFSQATHMAGGFEFPAYYWAPLIALYTGARLNEICQLHTKDIIEVEVGSEKIWCVSINKSDKYKSVKTGNECTIPLHPHLIELGFVEFVSTMKKSKYRWKDEHGFYRLWRAAEYSEADHYKRRVGDWFNGDYEKKMRGAPGFKQAVGIESDLKFRRDFHSFRHTIATALDNAGVPPHIGFQITGHTLDSRIKAQYETAGGGYRHGLKIQTMYDALLKLDFSDELKNVKPFFEICDERRLRNKVAAKKPKAGRRKQPK